MKDTSLNPEGYSDPTFYQAMKNIMSQMPEQMAAEEAKRKAAEFKTTVIHMAHVAGYQLEDLVIYDKHTHRRYRYNAGITEHKDYGPKAVRTEHKDAFGRTD